MIDWDLWRAKTEQDLAREHLVGAPDPDNAAWWACHWGWRYSGYWDKLCRAHEAICLMAWESNPPVLDQWHEESFEAIAALNAHVRGSRTTMQRQAYWLKREAIRKAMDRGLVFLRMVRHRAKCRTCEGTGKWTDWNSMWGRDPNEEPYREGCRRCSGSGTVNLDFHECNVANRFWFHHPHDHTTPFTGDQINWLRPWPTDWKPNQPAVTLPCEQGASMLELLKRRYWKDQPAYVHDIYAYMHVPSDQAVAERF